MSTLTRCGRHGAVIEVTCKRCGNVAYFSPYQLKDYLRRGDITPESISFKCGCGSTDTAVRAERGIQWTRISKLPERRRLEDDDLLFGR